MHSTGHIREYVKLWLWKVHVEKGEEAQLLLKGDFLPDLL